MKLHTYWRSSSAYRVRIALGFKGLAYEPRFVHLLQGGGSQHHAEFLSKNPLAQVPVLELEERGSSIFLTQSLAIIEYLEERFPEPPLLPRAALARARVRELAELINSAIQPFQTLSTLAFLGEAAPGLDKARWYECFVERRLVALEARARSLSGQYLVGDAVSIADVLLVPQLYAARRFSLSMDALPTLLEIEARCLALEAFATAHPDRQPDRE